MKKTQVHISMKELTSVIFQTSSRVCKLTARSTGGGGNLSLTEVLKRVPIMLAHLFAT